MGGLEMIGPLVSCGTFFAVVTLTWEAWLVLLVVLLMVAALTQESWPADLIVLAALMTLVVAGEATNSTKLPTVVEAVQEFGNPALVTVGALFVVVAGLMQTGAMSLLTDRLLSRPTGLSQAFLKLLLPVTISSAFLNNTPIVAMFMPVTTDLCKKANLSPSKLFMPMAFAATLGGVCTVIGTSTNIVVNGLMQKSGMPEVQLFELSWVGLPCAAVGVVYLLGAAKWLLPDRKPAISLSDDPRQYTVEMLVQPGGPLVGRTVEAAGLRHLPGLYLAEIDRLGEVLVAVSPRERLHANDRLVFVGVVESVVDLRKLRGLSPATDQVFKLNAPTTERCLIEAVVSNRCPLVGKTIREGRFRSTYDAAVLAVARGGQRLTGKIGDIVLQSGDTLLMEGHSDFPRQQRNSNHFYLVSNVENSAPPRHDRSGLALALMVGMIVFASAPVRVWLHSALGMVGIELAAPPAGKASFDMLTSALTVAILMILTRCCTPSEGKQAIDWSVLVVIGASFGIGRALESSQLALWSAEQLLSLCGANPWMLLVAVYFLTLLLTELVTNNAAAVLMFPLTMAAIAQLGEVRGETINYMPFMIAIMVAASCGFATPFGYQTNLMVYGPGGYKFVDYLRVGIPLDLLMMAITVALAPLVWPLVIPGS